MTYWLGNKNDKWKKKNSGFYFVLVLRISKIFKICFFMRNKICYFFFIYSSQWDQTKIAPNTFPKSNLTFISRYMKLLLSHHLFIRCTLVKYYNISIALAIVSIRLLCCSVKSVQLVNLTCNLLYFIFPSDLNVWSCTVNVV